MSHNHEISNPPNLQKVESSASTGGGDNGAIKPEHLTQYVSPTAGNHHESLKPAGNQPERDHSTTRQLLPNLQLTAEPSGKPSTANGDRQHVSSKLTPEQEKQATHIEQSINNGDLKGLQSEMESYHKHAENLLRVMEKVRGDEHKKGIVLYFQHGETSMAGDKNFHDEGSLTMFKPNHETLTVSTDHREGIMVGAKMVKEKDGTYTNPLVGVTRDPKAVMNEMIGHK